MRTFLKVNMISIMYALMLLIPIELVINVSRIGRITGWNLNVVWKLVGMSAFVSFILLSSINFYLTKKWLNKRKSSFWSLLLWLPYHILFIFIIASLFPVTNPADEGGPGDGLIILGLLFIYPFFVFVLNAFSFYSSAPDNK
ncbi:hypothetical protein [Mesobacillus maritimus]|uniref:Uncharacterized protein n=1 Tax=Mesobacillus maritimus TaxID=1643336 RepID=A0ABS7K0F6_9BACI|nr:hypothetical protein [Mesobacillus maritimus]MBY0095739.1 hypothetical protein [Mesobacillus maritimus]